MALAIKPKDGCRWDLISLGEVMVRFDPGEKRVCTTRSFEVYEGGGEYNGARGLKRCFGLDTAIATAFVDNAVGKLLQDLIYQGGVDQMRRALVGIMPDELLNRKRKAFVARAPLAAISADWASLVQMTQHLVSSSLRIVETNLFLEELQKPRQGQTVAVVLLMRTLTVESWLTTLADRRLLGNGRDEPRGRSRHSFNADILSQSKG